MTYIDLLRISLLEKDGEIKTDEGEVKSTCVCKSTAVFRFNEYVETTFPGANDEEREAILSGVSDKILHDLMEQTSAEYNHVGIWLTISGVVIENSIDLPGLKAIEEFAPDTEIVPIYEFIKMTLKQP
jgi:hypothetical protein